MSAENLKLEVSDTTRRGDLIKNIKMLPNFTCNHPLGYKGIIELKESCTYCICYDKQKVEGKCLARELNVPLREMPFGRGYLTFLG